jgi:hypothetical protein
MISAASPEGSRLVAGMIAVVQTFGDDLSWHPHVHALVSRGAQMRITAFITEPRVIHEILRHPAPHGADERSPPHDSSAAP